MHTITSHFIITCVAVSRWQSSDKLNIAGRTNRPVAGREGAAVSSAAAAEDFLRTKGGLAASERGSN